MNVTLVIPGFREQDDDIIDLACIQGTTITYTASAVHIDGPLDQVYAVAKAFQNTDQRNAKSILDDGMTGAFRQPEGY